MTTQAVNLYQVLKHTLNDSGAKAVVQYIEEYMDVMVSKHVDSKIAHLATKADLDALKLATKADLDALKLATKADLDAFKIATKADLIVIEGKIVALKDDLNQLEVKLVQMIMDTKAELMKWMFIFITGQTIVLAGLLKLFLKD